MAVFTSTLKSVAHGTLNWDSQMNADLAALETALNTKTVADQGSTGAPLNCNSGVVPGVYNINSGNNSYTNYPTGMNGYGNLIVFRSANQTVTQIVRAGGTFTRDSYDGTTWTNWDKLAPQSALDTVASYLAFATGAPTYTGGANQSLGANGGSNGYASRVGRHVTIDGRLVFGSGGSYGDGIVNGLGVLGGIDSSLAVGSGYYQPAGSGNPTGVVLTYIAADAAKIWLVKGNFLAPLADFGTPTQSDQIRFVWQGYLA